MPTNSLTDSQCGAAKPTDKPQKFFDGEGLHLYVTLTGSKTWRIAYRVGGKPQQKSFGPYPAVSLAEARKKRDELKAMLRDGIDPAAEKRASKPAKGVTFSDACATYWDGRSDVSAGYRANALRALEMHLVPRLGTGMIGRRAGQGTKAVGFDAHSGRQLGRHCHRHGRCGERLEGRGGRLKKCRTSFVLRVFCSVVFQPVRGCAAA